MRPHDLDPTALHTLLVVGRLGTFDAAAAALYVTPSAVSQRIKALESKVGQVLMTRTKPALPTASGEVLIRLATQWELLGRDALSQLAADGHEPGADTQPVLLALASNADSLATWLLPALASVQQEFPVVFELFREDERHSTDLLRHGTVLAAVTSDPTPVQGCQVTELGVLDYLPLATPAFARRWFPNGLTAATLGRAPMVAFDRKDPLQRQVIADVTGLPLAATIEPPTSYVPASRDFDDAVRLGMGWGMLPQSWVAGSLARGELVSLGDAYCRPVPLYWQHWALASPLMEAVTKAVVAQAGDSLRRDGTMQGI